MIEITCQIKEKISRKKIKLHEKCKENIEEEI